MKTIIAVLGCAVLFTFQAATARALPAQPAGCTPPYDYCPGDEIPVPGDTAPDVEPAGGTPTCVWVRNEDAAGEFADGGFFPVELENLDATAQDTNHNGYIIWERCDGAWTGNARWYDPDNAGPLVTPEQLADIIWTRLEGTLPAPEVASDPPADKASIISFPTFVQVTNWSGTVNDSECDPTNVLCVSVTAVPSLWFTPGEPGSESIACQGPGVRFVDAGPSVEEQAAAPEACTYAYQQRTGVEDRPDAWPGEVTVVWTLEWSSTTGAGGDLPDISKPTAFERSVTEVQTVIVDGRSGDD